MGLIDRVDPSYTSLDWNIFTFANPWNTILPHRYLLSAIVNEHECVLATNILKVVLTGFLHYQSMKFKTFLRLFNTKFQKI